MENINIYHRLIFGDSGNDIIFLKLIIIKLKKIILENSLIL